MEEGRNAFKILTGTLPGKRPLRRPRRRCEDNIRMDLKDIGLNTRNWVDSAQDRDYWRALVNSALNLWGSISLGVSIVKTSFSLAVHWSYKPGFKSISRQDFSLLMTMDAYSIDVHKSGISFSMFHDLSLTRFFSNFIIINKLLSSPYTVCNSAEVRLNWLLILIDSYLIKAN